LHGYEGDSFEREASRSDRVKTLIKKEATVGGCVAADSHRFRISGLVVVGCWKTGDSVLGFEIWKQK